MRILLMLVLISASIGCGRSGNTSPGDSAPPAPAPTSAAQVPAPEANVNSKSPTPAAQTDGPRTVREFFNLLPPKYFTLEGCEPARDPNCDKARAEYVKTFLEIEDAKNGYWKSGCDGGQSCLEMAIFKRPDGNYTVLVKTDAEMQEDSYFLEFSSGKWSDIGAKIVPEYSTKNIYVPPHVGTTVDVFKKDFPEPNFSQRGAKLYSLSWTNGKFIKQ